MVGRIVRSADFQRVLALPPRSRSTHFAAHFVSARPSLPAKPVKKGLSKDLSTGDAPSCPPLVDDSPEAAVQGWWLGMVVPKRHAKRAVTRNLLKRQMKAVMDAHSSQLPPGLWVLRLKSPFDKKLFASPASDPLRADARRELAGLLARAVGGQSGGPRSAAGAPPRG